jgi:hypothetical protein
LAFAVVTRHGRLADDGTAYFPDEVKQVIWIGQRGKPRNGEAVPGKKSFLNEAILDRPEDAA